MGDPADLHHTEYVFEVGMTVSLHEPYCVQQFVDGITDHADLHHTEYVFEVGMAISLLEPYSLQ